MKLQSLAPLALTAALAFTTFSAGAQTQTAPSAPDTAATAPRPMPNPEHQLEHMTRMLNLTDAQQQQIRPILVDRNQQMMAIRNNATLTTEQRQEQMRKLMSDSRGQVRNVLTDAQRQQWDEAREKRERRHREPAPAQPAPTTPPPAA